LHFYSGKLILYYLFSYLQNILAVRAKDEAEGIYFITFTCHQWLPLFEIAKGYDTVYKWFDYLKSKDHNVKGYVIMPIR